MWYTLLCSHHFGKSADLKEEVAHNHSLLPEGDPVQVEGEGTEISPPDQLVTQLDPKILKRKPASLLQPTRKRNEDNPLLMKAGTVRMYDLVVPVDVDT